MKLLTMHKLLGFGFANYLCIVSNFI